MTMLMLVASAVFAAHLNEEDEANALQRKLDDEFIAASNKASEGDARVAVLAWTRFLDGLPKVDDEELADLVDEFRFDALLARGSAHLREGKPQPAVADCNAALRIFPDDVSVLSLRAAAYEQMGEAELAAADRRKVEAMVPPVDRPPILLGEHHFGNPNGRAGPFRFYWGRRLPGGPTIGQQLASAALVLVVIGCLVLLLNVKVGVRQMRDGGGWRRLLFVAGMLTLLELAPFAATFGLIIFELSSHSYSTIVAGLVAFVVLVVFGLNWLKPVRWQGTKEAPPLLEDTGTLERVSELSARMGIDPPLVRVTYSVSGDQPTLAMAAGLITPTLIVSDGVMQRLSENERDGILAHEMAHIANRSLWLWAIATALCGVLTVLVTAWTPHGDIALFGLTLYSGVHRVLSRRLEFDCDLRAARAVGFRATSSALEKIHAGEAFRHSRLEPLIAAVSTHPSRPERLASLRDAAPPDDVPATQGSRRELRLRRLLAWLAAATWTFALGCSLYLFRYDPTSWVPTFLLFTTLLAPLVLILAGARTELLTAFRRAVPHVPLQWWARGAGFVLFLLYVVLSTLGVLDDVLPFAGMPLYYAHLALLCLILALVLFPNVSRTRRLERDVVVAFQQRDFAKALEIANRRSSVVARSPVLRHNVALAKAILGDRVTALSELEQLRADSPKLKQTWLTLASLYVDEGELERAVDTAGEIAPRLPKDPAPHLIAAWALRHLGRLDDAARELEQAKAHRPQFGPVHEIAAALALDRGDLETAESELATAEELAPGDVGNAFVRTEIALRKNDPNAPRLLEKLEADVRENPFSLLDKQVQALRRQAVGAEHS